MSEGKRSLISCIGNSNVKKWNFENDNKKRRLESDENSTSDSLFRLSQIDDKGSCFTSTQNSKTDGAGPSKPKYAPKPFVGENGDHDLDVSDDFDFDLDEPSEQPVQIQTVKGPGELVSSKRETTTVTAQIIQEPTGKKRFEIQLGVDLLCSFLCIKNE